MTRDGFTEPMHRAWVAALWSLGLMFLAYNALIGKDDKDASPALAIWVLIFVTFGGACVWRFIYWAFAPATDKKTEDHQ
jgi:hypothetical protein